MQKCINRSAVEKSWYSVMLEKEAGIALGASTAAANPTRGPRLKQVEVQRLLGVDPEPTELSLRLSM